MQRAEKPFRRSRQWETPSHYARGNGVLVKRRGGVDDAFDLAAGVLLDREVVVAADQKSGAEEQHHGDDHASDDDALPEGRAGSSRSGRRVDGLRAEFTHGLWAR